MRVANEVPDVQYNIQQSEQVLAAALQQVSTGLRVTQPSDDPAASASLSTSLAASANVDQYTRNITAVNSQLQTADSALSNVVTTLNTALSLGTEGANGTSSTSNRQAIAAQVQGVLTNVVAQANTSYQGVYVFGGSASSSAPVVQAAQTYITPAASVQPPLTATFPLTAGSVTTVHDPTTGKTFVFTVSAGETISSLTTAIANAASAGTLSPGTTGAINATNQLVISSNSSTHGIVVSSNDPALSGIAAVPGSEIANSYVYVGNSTVNTAQVGDSLKVATNLPGSQLFTAGANVVGALADLITALQTGTSGQIQTATQAIYTASNSLGLQRIPLDNSISQLNSQESYLGQEKVTLTTHQTALVGADLATAATTLAAAETQNSAVLAAAAKVLPQSLLNYLPA